MDDETLLAKLREIEARHAGLPVDPAPTAQEVTERMRARIAEARLREGEAVAHVKLPDPWQRAVFVALGKRYGLHVHQPSRQKHPETMRICAPPDFYQRVLWPEVSDLTNALIERFTGITLRVMEEVIDVEPPPRRDGPKAAG